MYTRYALSTEKFFSGLLLSVTARDGLARLTAALAIPRRITDCTPINDGTSVYCTGGAVSTCEED